MFNLLSTNQSQKFSKSSLSHFSICTTSLCWYRCSVESCVNKTIIWLYVCVSESLFNVSIVSRLIYTNCVIDSICTPFALFLHRFNQDFRESIHVEVVRVLCATFKIQWFLSLVFKVLVYAALRRFFSLTFYALETIVSIYLLYFLSLFESSIFVFLV